MVSSFFWVGAGLLFICGFGGDNVHIKLVGCHCLLFFVGVGVLGGFTQSVQLVMTEEGLMLFYVLLFPTPSFAFRAFAELIAGAFYGSLGCRAGDACPFLHDRSRLPGDRAREDAGMGPQSSGAMGAVAGNNSQDGTNAQLSLSRGGGDSTGRGGRRYESGLVERSKVVTKPVPKAQVDDPRDFQLQQLRRRFSPTERTEDDGTTLIFRMVPSDPDFPFEMVGLECELKVPLTYPTSGRPSLHVRNKEMGRGYQINVEKGFDVLVAQSPQATLLGLMNALDKRLEVLLSEQKAETIKLLPNAGPRPPQQKVDPRPKTPPKPSVSIPSIPTPQTYSAEQKTQAFAKREAETKQLEARLGRLPLFSKSSDGVVYTIPVEPRKRGDLPVPLQHVRTVKLFVPLLYNLQPCRIELQGVSKDAANTTETAFEQRAKAKPDMSLMAHVNYLSQNMHVLATKPMAEKEKEPSGVSSTQTAETLSHTSPEDVSRLQSIGDRSHIQVIPRPPEWNVGNCEDDETESDDYDSYDSGDESLDGAAEGHDPGTEESVEGPERGILLSFPFLELYGIELLELVSLGITVKCERCKDRMDVNNLRNNANGEASGLRSESCKKCASVMSIGMVFALVMGRRAVLTICRLQERIDACQLRACGILGSRWLHRRRSPSQVYLDHMSCRL